MSQKEDDLKGLKENVIIGKLIPAGTGLSRYRNSNVDATREAREKMYPNFGLNNQDSTPSNFGETDMADVDFANIDFGDMSLNDDFNPDDFLDDQGGQSDYNDEL